ncbi:MAG: RHS repeat-associated core domain-containing protein [Bacteroidaceae bacterium]
MQKKLSDSKRCFIGSGKFSRLKQVCLFGVAMLLFYICNKLTRYNHEQCGLDLYDYGARLYDPAAAFWASPDPLCEKYYNISPYAFCNDNPVTFIDPDGRKWKTLEDKEKATRIQEISMFHVRSLEKAIQKIKRKIEVANNDISLSEKARNRKIKRYKENLSELQYKKKSFKPSS